MKRAMLALGLVCLLTAPAFAQVLPADAALGVCKGVVAPWGHQDFPVPGGYVCHKTTYVCYTHYYPGWFEMVVRKTYNYYGYDYQLVFADRQAPLNDLDKINRITAHATAYDPATGTLARCD